jgi:hypothetical protein
VNKKNTRSSNRINYYVDDCGFIVNPDDYHNRLSLIDKKRFLANPELHRGWRISDVEITEARAWVKAHDELQAAYKGPRPSPAEQIALLAEMGLACGVYAPDEPVVAYPPVDCEDAGQPTGQRVDRLLAEYEEAYQYGVGGVFPGSPGAYHRQKREEIAAESYYRAICVRQAAECDARDRAAAA